MMDFKHSVSLTASSYFSLRPISSILLIDIRGGLANNIDYREWLITIKNLKYTFIKITIPFVLLTIFSKIYLLFLKSGVFKWILDCLLSNLVIFCN